MRLSKRDFNSQLKNFYVFGFLYKFCVYVPFIGLFLLRIKNFDNSEIALFFAIFSIGVFLLEIPTGIFADLYGGKVAVVTGSISMTISTLLLIYGNFYGIIIAEVFYAFSQTCFSGATESLLYDFTQNNDHPTKSDFTYIIGRFTSSMWLSIIVASLAGYFLNTISILAPLIATLIANVATVIISIKLPNVQLISHRTKTSVMVSSINTIITSKNLFLWILISTIVMSSIVSGYQLIQPFLNEIDIASSNNGLLYCLITVGAFISSRYYSKLIKYINHESLASIISALSLAAIFIFLPKINSLVSIFVVLFIYRFIWGFVTPHYIDNINRCIDGDSMRATILSIQSLLSNLANGILLFLFYKTNISSSISYRILSILLLSGVISLVSIKAGNFFLKKKNHISVSVINE